MRHRQAGLQRRPVRAVAGGELAGGLQASCGFATFTSGCSLDSSRLLPVMAGGVLGRDALSAQFPGCFAGSEAPLESRLAAGSAFFCRRMLAALLSPGLAGHKHKRTLLLCVLTCANSCPAKPPPPVQCPSGLCHLLVLLVACVAEWERCIQQ